MMSPSSTAPTKRLRNGSRNTEERTQRHRQRLQRILPPHVGGALDDAQPFIDDVVDADDPWTVGGLALQLLEVARIHGLAHQVQQADTRTVRTAKNEDDSSAISDSVDAVRIVTAPLRDADSLGTTNNYRAPR